MTVQDADVMKAASAKAVTVQTESVTAPALVIRSIFLNRINLISSTKFRSG